MTMKSINERVEAYDQKAKQLWDELLEDIDMQEVAFDLLMKFGRYYLAHDLAEDLAIDGAEYTESAVILQKRYQDRMFRLGKFINEYKTLIENGI
jgi:hypothetical protein